MDSYAVRFNLTQITINSKALQNVCQLNNTSTVLRHNTVTRRSDQWREMDRLNLAWRRTALLFLVAFWTLVVGWFFL